ncbi:hypothetical protein DF105_06660 [Burkholderia stagnalis]|nr:hypothetical protein DF117_05950 [Burkholderia stagnalis]RQZ01503.1 hypothetical protein DF106_04320 [Burkholderia stagnalis]RQZ07080.1 hypothetical protein DF105_06660 [Burkholderia stagnalis]
MPAYMVQQAFALHDALPRTANSKVDRTRLPAPVRVATCRCALFEASVLAQYTRYRWSTRSALLMPAP